MEPPWHWWGYNYGTRINSLKQCHHAETKLFDVIVLLLYAQDETSQGEDLPYTSELQLWLLQQMACLCCMRGNVKQTKKCIWKKNNK